MERSQEPGARDPNQWIALVRHGAPCVDPQAAPHTWKLSGEGERAVRELAAQLEELPATHVLCSPESKARSTALLLRPQVEPRVDEDLREQGLGQVPYLSAPAFERAVAECFGRPQAVVLGRESAAAAAQRMQRALGRLQGESTLVISHGRIISAFVGALLGMSGLQVWQTLRVPDVLLVNPAARHVTRLRAVPLFGTQR